MDKEAKKIEWCQPELTNLSNAVWNVSGIRGSCVPGSGPSGGYLRRGNLC